MKVFTYAGLCSVACGFTASPFGLGRPVSLRAATEATIDTTVAETEPAETQQFSADVSRVMEIIINSLYSDKDVFLRELVSNAADACDKKRFLSLTDGAATEAMGIRLRADAEARTLTIEDSGIGMSKDELVNNLGKIAQSGTKKFAEALGKEGADQVSLIGQFGVGFYSGFLVADEMSVETKSLSTGETHRWVSDSAGYSISSSVDEELPGKSGTRITLHLKEDASEYLEEAKLRELLRRYSEFISFPLELWTKQTKYEEVEEGEGVNATTKSVPVEAEGYEQLNSMQPIWVRKPKEVNTTEYSAFYKAAFRAYDEPLAHSHFALEGQVQFKAVLFVPSVLPYELSQNMFDEKATSLKLYVKRVFINDNFELVPRWLTFLRGVVDSDDLPLNVGREILQKSKMLSIISKRVVKKSVDMFKTIQKNEADFETFSKNYGKYLKVGIVEESGDTQKSLAGLVRFFSTTDETKQLTLADYKALLPANATKILYVSGDSKASAAASPVLEKLKKKGYPVLLLTEPLDELCLSSIGDFEGLAILDASKDDVGDLYGDEADEADAEKEEDFEDLLKFLTDTLGAKVSKVSLSKRLEESPAALVQAAYGMSPLMSKYMQAQATATGEDMSGFGAAAPAIEINAKHPIILKLKEADLESDDAKATASLIFDVAALTGGYEVQDTASFGKRVIELMSSA